MINIWTLSRLFGRLPVKCSRGVIESGNQKSEETTSEISCQIWHYMLYFRQFSIALSIIMYLPITLRVAYLRRKTVRLSTSAFFLRGSFSCLAAHYETRIRSWNVTFGSWLGVLSKERRVTWRTLLYARESCLFSRGRNIRGGIQWKRCSKEYA